MPTATVPPPTPTPSPTPGGITPGWNGQWEETDPSLKTCDSHGCYQLYNGAYTGSNGPYSASNTDVFNPAVGDTPNGGHGPVGNTIDQASCDQSMSGNYHIHVFIGIYINGTQYALPRGLGVAEPLNPNSPSINYTTQGGCFYYTHTHDNTGVLHVEDPNMGALDSPPMDSKYSLKTLFDVWGITVNNMQFGQFTGPVEVFTSGQQYRGGGASADIYESNLQPWYGDPNAIPLYSHEVIWFLVGPNYPSQLPGVHFFEEY